MQIGRCLGWRRLVVLLPVIFTTAALYASDVDLEAPPSKTARSQSTQSLNRSLGFGFNITSLLAFDIRSREVMTPTR